MKIMLIVDEILAHPVQINYFDMANHTHMPESGIHIGYLRIYQPKW